MVIFPVNNERNPMPEKERKRYQFTKINHKSRINYLTVRSSKILEKAEEELHWFLFSHLFRVTGVTSSRSHTTCDQCCRQITLLWMKMFLWRNVGHRSPWKNLSKTLCLVLILRWFCYLVLRFLLICQIDVNDTRNEIK